MSKINTQGGFPKGKQIGFLSHNPFPANSGNPPPPTQQQQQQPFMGFNGMLQNSQKWLGMFSQLGPLVNNISPMLRLLQGFNIGGMPIKYEKIIHSSEDMGTKLKRNERRIGKKRNIKRKRLS